MWMQGIASEHRDQLLHTKHPQGRGHRTQQQTEDTDAPRPPSFDPLQDALYSDETDQDSPASQIDSLEEEEEDLESIPAGSQRQRRLLRRPLEEELEESRITIRNQYQELKKLRDHLRQSIRDQERLQERQYRLLEALLQRKYGNRNPGKAGRRSAAEMLPEEEEDPEFERLVHSLLQEGPESEGYSSQTEDENLLRSYLRRQTRTPSPHLDHSAPDLSQLQGESFAVDPSSSSSLSSPLSEASRENSDAEIQNVYTETEEEEDGEVEVVEMEEQEGGFVTPHHPLLKQRPRTQTSPTLLSQSAEDLRELLRHFRTLLGVQRYSEIWDQVRRLKRCEQRLADTVLPVGFFPFRCSFLLRVLAAFHACVLHFFHPLFCPLAVLLSCALALAWGLVDRASVSSPFHSSSMNSRLSSRAVGMRLQSGEEEEEGLNRRNNPGSSCPGSCFRGSWIEFGRIRPV